MAAILAFGGIGCRREGQAQESPSPQSYSIEIDRLAKAGKNAECRQKAQEALARFGYNLYWRFRFNVYLDAGPEQFSDAFLNSPIPEYAKGTATEIYILWDRAALDSKHRKQWLDDSRVLAERQPGAALVPAVDFRLADYWFHDAKQPAESAAILESLLSRPQVRNQPRLLALAGVNLSEKLIHLERFSEAIAACQEAEAALAKAPQEVFIRATMENNWGWSLLQLGELDEGMNHLERAVSLYHQLGNPNEAIGLRNQAAVLARQGAYAKAQEKLEQSEQLPSTDAEDKAALLTDRAEVYIMDGHPDGARESLNKARRLSNFDGLIKSQDDAHIRFVEARIAEEAGDTKAALNAYGDVIRAPQNLVWGSMRLDASLRRAHLLAVNKQPIEAEKQYQDTEALLEWLRAHLDQDEAKLSFSDDSASKLYDGYVDFLVSRGQGQKALQVADRSRARLLSDYQPEQKSELNLAALQGRLQLLKGLALFYWLGSDHAYLWMVGPAMVSAPIELASPLKVRQLAKKYFEALSKDKEAREAGLELRDTLLAPARAAIGGDGRQVFMILDDTLGLINPEALPGFHSKWWIEEAVVSIAPSLGMLQRSLEPTKATIPMLAIGDATGTAEFPRLLGFSRELGKIKGLFPGNQLDVVSQERATPASYRNANPIRYEMIHFTAHGKAETRNPLDSAVILSQEPESKAFKLYARDIVKIPIQARLVTISACKSALSRTYRGEGVVGLAWAFLRSGARQVVAGLWNVDDESSQKLMVSFYRGIREEHKSPAVALHDAKLELMKTHADPYYWASFEIFAGSVEK